MGMENSTTSTDREVAMFSVTTIPLPAGNGSLSGHQMVCSCGLRFSTSLSLSQAQRDADKHLAYHAKQATTR